METETEHPSYPIGPTPRRLEAAVQIYRYMASRAPPPENIASKAIRPHYPQADEWMVEVWACQVLCMIAMYHMACVTRGLSVTSPVLPEEVDDKLPPPSSYEDDEDWTGQTNVRV